jgi:hypothetical protein
VGGNRIGSRNRFDGILRFDAGEINGMLRARGGEAPARVAVSRDDLGI